MGREVRPTTAITDITSTALRKNKWWYACKTLGTNNLKEGEM
jgi:hypothetical protein